MTEEKKQGLSRRAFLASTAVGAAAVASGSMVSLAAADEQLIAPAEETKVTFCRGNCGANMCQFDVTVREGKVVSMLPRINPDADPETKGRSKGCFRGISMMQTLYNERRVRYPMRRKEGTPRGGGEWERISWEEALDEIAEKWSGYIAEFGGRSICRWTVYGSTVMMHGGYGAWARLSTLLGFSKFLPGADQAMMWTVQQTMGQLSVGCDGPSIAEHSNNIIVWGANPGECSPHEFRYVLDAQKRGAKVFVLDPRVTVTATKADKYIPIRPSTDSAFAMAVCKYLIDNGMIDWTFQLYYTTSMYLVKKKDGKFLRDSDYGFEAVPNGVSNSSTGLAYVDDPALIWDNVQGKPVHIEEIQDPAFFGTFTADVNGEQVEVTTALQLLYERVAEWTLSRTAELCDVQEQDIIDIANALYNGPSILMIPNGLGHTAYSHTVYTAALAAGLLTGNFMKPGAGMGYCAVTSAMGWIPVSYYQYMVPAADPAAPVYAALKFPDIMETKQYAGQPAIIKSVVFVSGNPVSNNCDRQALLKALDKVEYVVTVDPIMTETAMHSDLVLPAAQWLEEEDTSYPMFTPYTPYGEECVPPTFEHMTDFEICKAIGCRMGYEALYTETFDEVFSQAFYTSMYNTTADGQLITRERLQQEKSIRIMPDGYYDTYFILQDYRCSFYNENPMPINNYGDKIDVERERMPYFEPPMEGWNVTAAGYKANPKAEKYPLLFMQVHNRYRTHTTTGYNPWLLELQDGPVLHMNVHDAEARGLKNNDIVRCYNDRGFVVIKLRVDNSIRPGMVDLPHGWQEDQFIAGHYQDLTPGFCIMWDCNDNYYDCLCEVEKYEEA